MDRIRNTVPKPPPAILATNPQVIVSLCSSKLLSLLPELRYCVPDNLIAKTAVGKVIAQTAVEVRVIQVCQGVHFSTSQLISASLIVYILGHLCQNLRSHFFLSQFLLYQPLAFGLMGKPIVLPVLCKSEVVNYVSVFEAGDSFFYCFAIKTSLTEALP